MPLFSSPPRIYSHRSQRDLLKASIKVVFILTALLCLPITLSISILKSCILGFSGRGSHSPCLLYLIKTSLLLHGHSKIVCLWTLPWKVPLQFCMDWSFTPFRFLLKNYPLKDSISLLIKEMSIKTNGILSSTQQTAPKLRCLIKPSGSTQSLLGGM